ncbi:MAG: DUF2065 domain-containing protein [Pseudomonadota bacterium]
MAWGDLFTALALVLIIEGLMPSLNPEGWRRTIATLANMDNGQLRMAGLISMVAGSVLLYLVRA